MSGPAISTLRSLPDPLYRARCQEHNWEHIDNDLGRLNERLRGHRSALHRAIGGNQHDR